MGILFVAKCFNIVGFIHPHCMRLSIWLLVLIISIKTGLAQYPVSPNARDAEGLHTGFWTILLDSAFKETSNKDSVRYYRLARFEAGKPTGKVRDFFRSGTKQWDGYMSSINPDIRAGEANQYFETGQMKIKSVFLKDKLNGPYQEWDINGKLIYKGVFKDDLLEGKLFEFYPTGVVKAEMEFKNGITNGIALGYFADGKIQNKGHRKNGYTDGLFEEFSENGQLKIRGLYKEGNRRGSWEQFSETGVLKEKSIYNPDQSYTSSYYYETGELYSIGPADSLKNGQGIWKFLYPNGTIKKMGPYQDDHHHGVWTFNHENGKLWKQGNYVLDSMDGQWIFYYENEKKETEGSYTDNKKNGLWKYYNEHGILTYETNYINNKQNGTALSYYEHGALMEKVVLTNNTYDGAYEKYYENGQLMTRNTYQMGEPIGNMEEFHPDGSVHATGKRINGKREGEWRWWFANGKPETLETYANGLLNGPWAMYHVNGNIRSKGIATNGEKEGYTLYYFSDGRLEREGSIAHSLYEGKWTYYDSITGGKESVGIFVNGKLNGKVKFYDAAGKPKHPSYYVNGFWETASHVSDSIYSLIAAGEYDQAWKDVDWLKQVIKRDKKKDDPVNHLPSYFYGVLSFKKDNYQTAIKWYQENVEINKRLAGDSSETYMTALNGIAMSLTQLGKNQKALDQFDKILDLVIKHQGQDSDDYFIFASNKAFVLAQMNLYTEAEAIYLNELKRREDKFGAGHQKTWGLMWWLGKFYKDLKNYDQCIATNKSLLKVSETDGHENESYGISARRNIGESYKILDQRKESVWWMKQVIALQEKEGVKNTSNYVEDLMTLAHAYLGMNMPDSANQVYTKGFDLLTKRNATNSFMYTKLMNGQGQLYYQNYYYKEAVETWKQVIENLERLDLKNSSLYGSVLNNLSLGIYNGSRNLEEAEKYLQQSVEIAKEADGETSYNYRSRIVGLGEFYRKTSRFDKAFEYLKLGEQLNLKYASESSDELKENLLYLGNTYYSINDYAQAIQYLERSLKIALANQHNDPGGCAYVLDDLANCYKAQGQYDVAEKYKRQALEVIKENLGENNLLYWDYTTYLADLLSHRGLHSDAEPIYLTVLKAKERLAGTNTIQYGYTLRDLGNLYSEIGNYKKSKKYFTQYHTIALQTEGLASSTALGSLSRLANVNNNLDLVSEAESQFKQAVTLSRDIYGKDNMEYAWKLSDIADFYINNSRESEAEKYIAEAMAISKNVYGSSHRIYANFLSDLSKVYIGTDRYKEAEELLLSTTNIQQKFNSGSWEYIYALSDLEEFYAHLGRIKDATKISDQVLNLVEKRTGRDLNYANYLEKKSALEYQIKNYEAADTLARMALSIVEEEQSPGHFLNLRSRNMIGVVALARHQLDEAEEQFKYCIDQRVLSGNTTSSDQATSYHNLAYVFIERDQFAEAEKSLNQAAEIEKKYPSLSIENKITRADSYAKLYQAWGKYDLSEKYWKQVTSLTLSYIEGNFYFMTENEKAQFWNNYRKHLEYFNTFAVLRQSQNSAILGDMYNNQLSTKAILLSASNKIRNRILSSKDSVMINDYYRWTESKNQLAQYYTMSELEIKSKKVNIDSVEKVTKTLEKDLNITIDDQEKDKNHSKLTWRDVQRTLSTNEAAIEIIRFRIWDKYFTDSVAYAALILTSETKTAPLLVVLKNGKQLEEKAIRYYKNSIAAKLEDKLSYANFWESIGNTVKGKSHLYLSLDGVFNQINFNTLRTPENKFLVDDKNFTIVSNTKDIVSMKKKPGTIFTRASAALIGYPKYFLGPEQVKNKIGTNREVEFLQLDATDATGIAELPGTKTEIQLVNRILSQNKWAVDEYEDENASEQILKSIQPPRVLHIATHGFFMDDEEKSGAISFAGSSDSRQDPMLRSGLLLTGAANFIQNKVRIDDENGILTAYEAANLNLDNTDLVVLSACETGRGEIQNGEGVYGLQRAFQTAGAKAIIMSLWKVDDEATQQLMTLFYQNWMKGQSKTTAFKNAQLELKKKFEEPYFWGAFVMMGE